MTGTDRVNQAAQGLSRGLPVPENLVTQRMGEVFPDGISNRMEPCGDIARCQGNTFARPVQPAHAEPTSREAGSPTTSLPARLKA